MKILIINGANLDMLGKRDPEQYGSFSLTEIEKLIQKEFDFIEFSFFQSALEGEIVAKLNFAFHEDYQGLIINPGGFAHTSVVIRDALDLLKIPKIEVHLSNIAAREPFRQILLTASVCDGYISGLKEDGYIAAVTIILRINKRRKID
jgi:3-dehydroquinate dehydratase II